MFRFKMRNARQAVCALLRHNHLPRGTSRHRNSEKTYDLSHFHIQSKRNIKSWVSSITSTPPNCQITFTKNTICQNQQDSIFRFTKIDKARFWY